MRLPVGLSHPPESADMVAPAERDETLNLFCDRPVPAFEAEGGEALKFMGDGRLAIFRIGAAPKSRPRASVSSRPRAARMRAAQNSPPRSSPMAARNSCLGGAASRRCALRRYRRRRSIGLRLHRTCDRPRGAARDNHRAARSRRRRLGGSCSPCARTFPLARRGRTRRVSRARARIRPRARTPGFLESRRRARVSKALVAVSALGA